MFNLNSIVNPSSANPAKWSNTLKQFVGEFSHKMKFQYKGSLEFIFYWIALNSALKISDQISKVKFSYSKICLFV